MIKITLENVLKELNITRNKLAVESKVRPATIADMYYNKTRRVELDTLDSILIALNQIAKDQGIDRKINVESIIKFE